MDTQPQRIRQPADERERPTDLIPSVSNKSSPSLNSPVEAREMLAYLTPPPSNVSQYSPKDSSAQSNPPAPLPISEANSGRAVAFVPPSVPTQPSPAVTTKPPALTRKTTRRRRGLFIGLLALVVLLMGGSLAAYFAFFAVPASTNVGRAFDPATWKYYAQLPQAVVPGDPHQLRGLDHIRHLYYNENHVRVLGLYGGLDIWCFRNTDKILEWSLSARDDFTSDASNYALMHDLFISILDYLDGIPNVSVDVPPGTPVRADSTIANISLLTVDPSRQGVAQFLSSDPPGDLDHMALHLSELVKAPDVSPESRQLAQDSLRDLSNAKGWLQQVRADAKELFNMDSGQLAQPHAQNVLEDLATQATYAYIGQLDPATNKVVPGVLQAHYAIQKLATFDITNHVSTSLS